MSSNVLDKTEASAPVKMGAVNRVRAALASVLVTAAFVVGNMGAAHAAVTTTDPTGGAAEDFLGSLTSWVTTHGVPLIFGLLLIGVTIAVATKYGRKGARAL